MITGRFTEVNNRYYAVLNLKHPYGSRLQKRFDLELPVPNNKRRATERLNALCEAYTRKQQAEQRHPNVLLTDFLKHWMEERKSEFSLSTYRTLPLFEPLTSLLRAEWLRKGDFACNYVCSNRCGKPMRPDVLTHEFNDFLATHSLRHIHFHDLRHSCASLLIAAHVPLIQVQHWLGHTTMLTTADLYSHLNYDLIAECGDALKKKLGF